MSENRTDRLKREQRALRRAQWLARKPGLIGEMAREWLKDYAAQKQKGGGDAG